MARNEHLVQWLCLVLLLKIFKLCKEKTGVKGQNCFLGFPGKKKKERVEGESYEIVDSSDHLKFVSGFGVEFFLES